MVDDDSDDEEETIEPLPKKRMTESQSNDSVPPAAPRGRGGFLVDDDSPAPDEATEPGPNKRTTEPQPNGSLPPTVGAADLKFSMTDSTLPDAQVDQLEYSAPDIDEPIDFSQVASLGPMFAAATRTYKLKTSDGAASTVGPRKTTGPVSYESMVAARSRTKEGRAKRA